MLDAIAELGRDAIRHVARTLRDVVDADALRADQPRDALDLVEHGLGRVVEQQVRLVEQEHELRLIEIADFGQLFEQLGQHPQQERGVEARRIHQLLGGENVDDAAPVGRRASGSR